MTHSTLLRIYYEKRFLKGNLKSMVVIEIEQGFIDSYSFKVNAQYVR